LLNDLDGILRDFRNADNLRCEEVLAIDRSVTRDRHDFSAELIEDCRRDVVLVDTIPRKVKSLPNTGGPPLVVLLAAGVLLVSGLLTGASVHRTVTRRGE
jgi:hypothetical protein